MQEIELRIKNFPQQQEIFNHPARYKIVPKGRRFGITRGAANDYIKSALAGTFQKGLWIDTVNTNIDRYIERYFIPHLKKLPSGIWGWRKQDKIVTIRDSYIDFRSADRPENIEGFGYDKFFINEAGIVLKDEYLWNNAIRPMLWDFNASGVIGGTPKGKGVFWDLAQRAQDTAQPRYAYFHFSSFDNPYMDQENLREEMKDMPERVIRQEIHAEFLDDTGVVFRNVSSVCTETTQEPILGHVYVMGVDLAKVQDFTVIAVYDRATNKQVYQMRFNKLEWPFQKKMIEEVCRKYNRALINIDATGIGDPIADDLMRAGLPVEPLKLTNISKKELIEKLSIWIEQKRLSMLRIPETVTEFNNFTYDISSSGRIMYNAPVGFNDDIVIAHALAVWLLQPLVVVKEHPKLSIIQADYEEVKKARERARSGEHYIDSDIEAV